MHDLRTLFSYQLRAFVVVAALGALVPLQVAAQTIPAVQRLDRFHVFADGNIVSAKYQEGYEGYGTRLNLARGANASPTTGGVSLSKQLALNTKNGIVVAEATQKISSRQIAKGIAGVASGPLGLALLAAPAIIELFSEADIELSPEGLPSQTVVTDIGCNSYPQRPNFTACGGEPPTPALPERYVQVTGSGARMCYQRDFCGGALANGYPYFNVVDGPASVEVTEQVPLTSQQLEDALTAVNPGPAALNELADKGQFAPDPDPSDTPKVQNPVPSQDKTTTKTNPDGSTETTVCRTSGTQVGDNIKLTEQCTITARDPAGNVTSTTSTDTDDAAPQAGSEQSMFCTLFPDVLACAKFGEATEQVPTSTRNVTFSEESLFGGGSCPTDQTFTFKGSSIPITNYAHACDLLQTYVRPLAILLAFFTGLMIIARGMPE